jgi:hypothetical protein
MMLAGLIKLIAVEKKERSTIRIQKNRTFNPKCTSRNVQEIIYLTSNACETNVGSIVTCIRNEFISQ